MSKTERCEQPPDSPLGSSLGNYNIQEPHFPWTIYRMEINHNYITVKHWLSRHFPFIKATCAAYFYFFPLYYSNEPHI